MILKVIAFITMAMLTQSIGLTLQDGNHIVFNSSMYRDSISVSLASYGKINSSFEIESELLSPLINRHRLIHG